MNHRKGPRVEAEEKASGEIPAELQGTGWHWRIDWQPIGKIEKQSVATAMARFYLWLIRACYIYSKR